MTRSGTRDVSRSTPADDPPARPRNETAADGRWRTSTHSHGSCVQAQPVDAVVRGGVIVVDDTSLAVRTARTPTPTETVEETPSHRAPWYIEHGMLGEVTVVGVARWEPGAASAAVQDAVGDLDLRSAGNQVADLVRARITALLADDDPRVWDAVLERGELHAEHGRLVWIRPEPVDPRPADQVGAAPLRAYDVRFASTSSTTEESRSTTSTVDAMLFTAITIGTAAASSQVVGLPTVSGSASTSTSRGVTTSVVTGRKLFVSRSTRFLSDVRFRVFVDGVEIDGTPGTVRRGIALDLPSVFTAPDEPRPVLTSPAQHPDAADGVTARPLTGDEVLHAIDLTPVVAAEQARLRSAGIAPMDALTISTHLQEVLNERNARNTSRWWLTTGSPPRRVSTNLGAKMFRGITGGFTGYFRVRASLQGLQRLGTTDDVPTRTDLGTGRDTTIAAGGSRTVAATVSTNTTGLVSPSLRTDDGVLGSGIAPLASLTLGRTREWTRRQGSKTANHTVLNVTARQTRYRAVLDVTVVWESTTNDALARRPSSTTRANSELGVPALGSRDALELERRLLGTTAGGTSSYGPGPLVRTLPRPRGGPSFTRPAVLHEPRVPGPREPLALASRAGLGFAVGSALPGSELVAEHLRMQLQQVARQHRITGVDWAVVHRELTVNFGTPRLEADLDAALTGIKHTVQIGGTTVHVMVRLHLATLVRTVRYPAVTNTRAVVDDSISGRSATGWAVQASVGAGARLSFPGTPQVRVQTGPLRLIGQLFRTHGEQFGAGTAAYRRLENVGDVDEHTLDAVYESTLHVEGDHDRRHPDRWWTHDPGNTVATILVPTQQIPARPVTATEAASAGQFDPAQWEASPPGRASATQLRGSYLDFTSGAAAVYPAFLSLPGLGRVGAALYAQLHGLSDEWATNGVRWPVELHDLGRPSWLASRLGALTGPEGVTIELPERAGWQTTIQVMMRASVRGLVSTDVDTEIEQYSKATRDRVEEQERGTSVGVQLGAGLLAGMGAYATDDDELLADGSRHDEGERPTARAGGRLTALLHGGVEGTRSTTTKRTTGFLDITRATYGDAKTIVRTDPVFRLTVSRRRTVRTGHRSRVEHAHLTRHVRFANALDVMLPQRRAREVVPTPSLDVPVPAAPRRTYGGVGLPRTSVHTEQLSADEVLATVMDQITRHGVVGALDDGIGGRTDPVRQALDAMFRSDALVPQMPALLTSGIWAWLPVRQSFGGARFLWVRVTIDQVGTATAAAPRPEVKLTLRGESLGESATTSRRAFTQLYGGTVLGNGGRAGDQESRHGGGEARFGWLRTADATTTTSTRSVDILRLGTRDKEGSYEFEHPVTFRVETALVDERSEMMAVLAEAFSTLKRGAPALTHRLAAAAGRTAPLVAHPSPAGRTSRLSQPWRHTAVWKESGTVTGTARFLVPYHLTREIRPGDAAAAVFRRDLGRAPRWAPATATVQRPPAAFVEHLHPGDVNTDAIQRWAWVAAHAPVAAGPQPASTADHLGLEPFHDLAYLHDTSHGAIRPRIAELLTGSYPVRFRTETVHVGIELRAARELFPDQDVESKARRYRQVDTAAERSRSAHSGWFASVGPEVGGPMGAHAGGVARAPYEHKSVTGTKQTARDSTTHETNREGTLRFRHFAFDVTLVARLTTAPRQVLKVDVPDGLVGALPLEGTRLVGDLGTLLGQLLSGRSMAPPQALTAAAAHTDRTGSEVVWRASSHSDGVACVSASVVLLRCAAAIASLVERTPRSGLGPEG